MQGILKLLSIEESTAIGDFTNPLLDENGELITGEEAINHFSELWKQWDIVNKFIAAIPKIIIAVIIIIAGYWLTKFISKLVIKALVSRNVDSSVYKFIKNMISFFINLFSVLFALSLFININSFLAAIGGLGLAAGLGLQNSISQFVSGISILFNKQFKTGDFISVDGHEGFVAEIRFMNTVITTFDNKRIIIPNSHITSNSIVNYSAEEKRRVNLIFSVAYCADIAKAKAVILETVSLNEKALKDPEPVVNVNSLEASSVDLVVKVWCMSGDYWDVYYGLTEEVKLAFDKNKIEIPFNQLDIHITDKNN